jgi:hypothetical protein
MRAALAVLSLGAMVASWADAAVDVQVTPAIRQYCHIIRFPQGWTIRPYIRHNDVLRTVTPIAYSYWSDYEFRLLGLIGTRFLVRGIDPLYKIYTNNAYELDLSETNSLPRPATEQEWQDGTKIPDSRPSDWRTFANIHLTNAQALPFRGLDFIKSGDIWAGEARLSPDQQWIVLLSSSGSVAKHDEFLIFGERDKGKLFFDVFNADTGRKLMTILGTYSDINPGAVNKSLWVTDRYFIVPLGETRERCLICDLGPVDGEGRLRP